MPARQPFLIVAAIVATLILDLSGAGTGLAQEKSPSVKFNLFSVKGLVTGKTVNINAEYGKKFNIPVPAPFSFLVPDKDGVSPLVNTPKAPDGMLIKINFATPDRQLIENFQFVTLTLPMGEQQARLIELTGLLANTAYDQVVRRYPKNKYLGARQIKVGKYPAIEVLGRYVDPKLGLMHTRIVGIPNPNGAKGVIFLANIVDARVDIKFKNDLARTLSGTALRFFKYRGK